MNKPKVKTSKEVIEHINPERPVFVYRNLHKKCLSVQQDGIVRCHVDNIVLEDAEFRVSKAGQKRVRDEKKRTYMRKLRAWWLRTQARFYNSNGTRSTTTHIKLMSLQTQEIQDTSHRHCSQTSTHKMAS